MERTKKLNSLQNVPDFLTSYANSTYHGTKTITDPGSKVWDFVPEEIK